MQVQLPRMGAPEETKLQVQLPKTKVNWKKRVEKKKGWKNVQNMKNEFERIKFNGDSRKWKEKNEERKKRNN